MVSRLFKIKRPKSQIVANTDFFAQSEYISLSILPNLRNCCLSCLPSHCCLCCCSRSRKEKAL